MHLRLLGSWRCLVVGLAATWFAVEALVVLPMSCETEAVRRGCRCVRVAGALLCCYRFVRVFVKTQDTSEQLLSAARLRWVGKLREALVEQARNDTQIPAPIANPKRNLLLRRRLEDESGGAAPRFATPSSSVLRGYGPSTVPLFGARPAPRQARGPWVARYTYTKF